MLPLDDFREAAIDSTHGSRGWTDGEIREVDIEIFDTLGASRDLIVPVKNTCAVRNNQPVNKRVHGVIFKTLGAMFVGIFIVWGLVFRNSPPVLFNLAVCLVYLAMYLGGPLIVTRVQGENISDDKPLRDFLDQPFDTYTGRITGAQAWTQICLIPGALLICTVGMAFVVAFTT